MFPILARTPIGFIYTFTVIWGISILAGVVLTARSKRIEFPLEGWLAGIAGGLVGGRLVFIAINLEYFRENMAETWRLTSGGYSYYGVLGGGLAALWIWSRATGRFFERQTRPLGFVVPLLHLGGWTACYLDGCAFGRETTLSWYAAVLPDGYGIMNVRIQTQLAGFLLSLVLLFLTGWRRWTTWRALGFMLIGQGLLSIGRGDGAFSLAGVHVDLFLGIGGGLAALLGEYLVGQRVWVEENPPADMANDDERNAGD